MPKKIIFLSLIIFINVSLVYSEVINIPSKVKIPGCGDGLCGGNETCNNCKVDCGECFIPSGSGGGGGSGGGSSFSNPPGEINGKTEVITCNEYWICDDWSECTHNEQHRSCYDLEKCNTTLYSPEEKRVCKQESVSSSTPINKSNQLFIIPILIIILILIYLSRRKKKKKGKKKLR